MITQGIEKALKDILLEVYFSANEIGSESEQMLEDSLPQVLTLVRAEAINLADKIIGKDIVLHNLTDTDGTTFLDPSEKAIFDHQVKQRIELAVYQNPPQAGPTGPEEINEEVGERSMIDNGDGTVTLNRELYNTLKLNSKKLHALEGAGVDNWEGYEIAMDQLKG